MQFGVGIQYFGIVHATWIAFQIVVLRFFDRIELALGSRRNFIFLSAVVGGAIIATSGVLDSLVFSIFSIVVGAGLVLARGAMFRSYVNKYIPSKTRATTFSSITMFFSLGTMVVYPFVGLLADWSVNFTLVVVGCSIVAVALVSRVKESHLKD
jgi:hypothetical protein